MSVFAHQWTGRNIHNRCIQKFWHPQTNQIFTFFRGEKLYVCIYYNKDYNRRGYFLFVYLFVVDIYIFCNGGNCPTVARAYKGQDPQSARTEWEWVSVLSALGEPNPHCSETWRVPVPLAHAHGLQLLRNDTLTWTHFLSCFPGSLPSHPPPPSAGGKWAFAFS